MGLASCLTALSRVGSIGENGKMVKIRIKITSLLYQKRSIKVIMRTIKKGVLRMICLDTVRVNELLPETRMVLFAMQDIVQQRNVAPDGWIEWNAELFGEVAQERTRIYGQAFSRAPDQVVVEQAMQSWLTIGIANHMLESRLRRKDGQREIRILIEEIDGEDLPLQVYQSIHKLMGGYLLRVFPLPQGAPDTP